MPASRCSLHIAHVVSFGNISQLLVELSAVRRTLLDFSIFLLDRLFGLFSLLLHAFLHRGDLDAQVLVLLVQFLVVLSQAGNFFFQRFNLLDRTKFPYISARFLQTFDFFIQLFDLLVLSLDVLFQFGSLVLR